MMSFQFAEDVSLDAFLACSHYTGHQPEYLLDRDRSVIEYEHLHYQLSPCMFGDATLLRSAGRHVTCITGHITRMHAVTLNTLTLGQQTHSSVSKDACVVVDVRIVCRS